MVGKPTSSEGYSNILTVIDEYSHFPFAFPTKDRSSATVIQCHFFIFLDHQNLSIQIEDWNSFHWRCPTSCHPGAFTKVELLHTTQQAIHNVSGLMVSFGCILYQNQLDIYTWPHFLGKALHCIRSLHCSSTGTTPHAHLFNFNRHPLPVPCHSIIPAGNYAWLRHFIRHKNDSSGELVKIAVAYPGYAVVARDGQSTTDTINWKHLAPHPGPAPQVSHEPSSPITKSPILGVTDSPSEAFSIPGDNQSAEYQLPLTAYDTTSTTHETVPYKTHSGRVIRKPDWYK